MLEWTLSAFQSHPAIDAIVIAGAVEELERIKAAAAGFSKVQAVVQGGASRQESVRNGVSALPQGCTSILVHDAARPAVSANLISRVIEAVGVNGAAIPGVPITDTVKRTNGLLIAETVDRQNLWTVQTPQGAKAELLLTTYRILGDRIAQMTDEAGILEASGVPVTIVEGEPANIKVTTPEDLDRVSEILVGVGSIDEMRTGFGYDVHSFAEGRKLWLGGVEIPHECGLAGHSDADVVLHAVCDALLGAAGMGDIGVLFPDTDAAHKDRPSIEFVREVKSRLDSAGWAISNIDVSLLAEAPRIGPHRAAMVAAISGAVGILPDGVNIKATTSERMGFVGRKEGMACWAVATLCRRSKR